MGWDFYHADYYTPKGDVDRKREIESQLDSTISVVKSQMIGTVYYAAVKNSKGEVYGLVVLTKTDARDYFNFGSKWMDESMGPCYYDCPVSILDALTPTDSEFANEWRRKCRKKQANKKGLKSLPYGGKIKFVLNEKEYILIKKPPMYQFKTDWWLVSGRNTYFRKKDIPADFEII